MLEARRRDTAALEMVQGAVNPWWGAWAFVAGGVLTAAVLIAWAYKG